MVRAWHPFKFQNDELDYYLFSEPPQRSFQHTLPDVQIKMFRSYHPPDDMTYLVNNASEIYIRWENVPSSFPNGVPFNAGLEAVVLDSRPIVRNNISFTPGRGESLSLHFTCKWRDPPNQDCYDYRYNNGYDLPATYTISASIPNYDTSSVPDDNKCIYPFIGQCALPFRFMKPAYVLAMPAPLGGPQRNVNVIAEGRAWVWLD
ncbi:hypothetical protein HK097_005384 [Rhizophlyctis rosea]|uniref:Uncharacterized protein n=1 Tax=Rhizophlyctis rosea TaxID=64517 RepID=A0AAD5SF30_9FUNG|nr:hypothetical protein HK097_005384 [Rhizophlyctis rosea]